MSVEMTEPAVDEERLNFWKDDYGIISTELMKVDWEADLQPV